MSSGKNFISYIILIIFLFGKIFNQHDPNSHLKNNDRREQEPNEKEKDIDNQLEFKEHNMNNKNKNENNKQFDNKQNSGKQNIIEELRKKNNDIIKMNKDSKNKLQKYNLFYSIMVVINVILALIIISFVIYNLYYYISYKRNNNLEVSISNNNSKMFQKNNYKDIEKDINKSNLIIERINERPIIDFEVNNENLNDAPTYIGNKNNN